MNTTIFNFTSTTDTSDWQVVDDTVMGGRSDGKFKLDDGGNGVFYGHVSLENNGGFSSVQYKFDAVAVAVDPDQIIRLRIKGDGSVYQFRVKDKISKDHSYIYKFETTGEWQIIDIPLNLMSPQFRGRKLKMPNFNKNQIEQVTFLIGNKKAQDFKLCIDKISILD